MVIKTLPAGESYIQMLPSPDWGSQLFLPFKGRIKVGMGFNAGTNEQDNSSKQPPAQLASQHDRCREKTLEDAGFHVLRFWNHEVLQQPEAVAERMWQEVTGKKDPSSPPPSP